MQDFPNKDALSDYLKGINSRYSKYAKFLWKREIKSRSELANASINSLATMGIIMAHAEVIQNHVKKGKRNASDAESLFTSTASRAGMYA